MSSVSESTNSLRREFAVRQSVADWTILSLLRPLHVVLAAPSLLFIATLAIMLFRPPDVQFHSLDRIAFLALIFVVLLRTLATQERFQFAGPVTLPMLGLLLNCILQRMGGTVCAGELESFCGKMARPVRSLSSFQRCFYRPHCHSPI